MGRNCNDMAKVTKARIGEANRELGKRIALLKAEFLAAQPDGHLLSVGANAYVNRKRPQRLQRELIQLVQRMIVDSDYRNSTNKQIIAALSCRFPDDAIPDSIMYDKLKAYQKKALGSLLAGFGHYFSLDTHNTLSRIKSALQGNQDLSNGKTHRVYERKFSFREKEVVVGDRRFEIIMTNSNLPRIRVGNQWINVTTLERLLSNTSAIICEA